MKQPGKLNIDNRGFSLVEVMLTMLVFFVILFGVYSMVSQFTQVTRTENARERMVQESRFLMGMFADDLKGAGSVITLGAALSASASSGVTAGYSPSFFGIYPLNNTNYPDGIILASGDPETKTNLKTKFIGTDTTLAVDSLNVPGYNATRPNDVRQWAENDKVIVLGSSGYVIGLVSQVNVSAGTLSLRAERVYYSGLLNTTDPISSRKYVDSSTVGNSIEYPVGSPVMRLSSFCIYLFKTKVLPGVNRNIRQLLKIIDTRGIADILSQSDSHPSINVVSENIYDMQISYVAYTNFSTATRTTARDPNHTYYNYGTSNILANLLSDISNRILKEIDVTIVVISDQYGGTRAPGDLKVPRIMDQATYLLPKGKYGYRLMSLSIDPRNFNLYSKK